MDQTEKLVFNADERYATIAEVAFTMSVSPYTVAGWIRRGKLKAIRVGGRVLRIPRSDLQRLLAEAQVG